MIEYKYNRKEGKFTENGHTMFEYDVLQRLKRLAALECRIKNVSKEMKETKKEIGIKETKIGTQGKETEAKAAAGCLHQNRY